MDWSPTSRTRIAAISSACIAIWLGSAVANQEMFLPGLVVGGLGLLLLVTIQPVPVDALLLGGVLFGYIVGNRGFAQLHPPNLPLLPAEFALVVSGAIIGVRCTQHRILPLRTDFINLAILTWIAISSVRLFADVKTFGFMALRDYATVYYAAFFYLGQQAAASTTGRSFLRSCLIISCIGLAVMFPLFVKFPAVFFGPLSFQGVPIIFFKGDLAGTFLAVGSILFYVRYEQRRSVVALIASLIFAGGTLLTNNRASMLGLIAATLLLGMARRWRFAVIQVLAAAIAATMILFVVYVRGTSWHQTPLYGLYERTMSLVDPSGQRTYSNEDAADKGDNNRFRMVWWRAVYDETISIAPLTGLGYGYDLADRFVEKYYPEAGEEFTTRSPHNVVLTVFARTGLAGLLPFLAVIAALLVSTIRTARSDLESGGLWLGCCAILVSACFGVVLEGPMGAVVFWTVLGVANACRYPADEALRDQTASATDPSKPATIESATPV
jgi:hypothetical protein